MPRGRVWSQEEVESLLSLVRESGEASQLTASTSRPNEALWEEIARGMAAAGYTRSVAQCRAKWKALKQAFHSEGETRQRARHHSLLLSPYYRAMKSIWTEAGQPAFDERRMRLKLPFSKHRSPPATRSLALLESPVHDLDGGTSALLQSPLLPSAKDEPGSSGCGDHVTGLPSMSSSMPHTSNAFPPVSIVGNHGNQKQEETKGKPATVACVPGEISLGMGRGNQLLMVTGAAPGSHGTAPMNEHPAEGPSVAGLLQNIQQLLAQILETSRQQQVLLESLASDTVSCLNILSHSLTQVGETLHQLLTQTQTLSSDFSRYVVHTPLLEGHHISPDHKEETLLPTAASCTPM